MSHDLWLFNLVDLEREPVILLLGTFSNFKEGFETSTSFIENLFGPSSEAARKRTIDYFRTCEPLLVDGGVVQDPESKTLNLQVVRIRVGSTVSVSETNKVIPKDIEEPQKKRRSSEKN